MLAGLSLDDQQYKDGKPSSIRERDSGQDRRKRGALILLHLDRQGGSQPRNLISDELSSTLNNLQAELENSDLFDDLAPCEDVLNKAIPQTLVKEVGLDTLMKRLPEPYQRALFSSWVAAHFIYKYGPAGSNVDFFNFARTLAQRGIYGSAGWQVAQGYGRPQSSHRLRRTSSQMQSALLQSSKRDEWSTNVYPNVSACIEPEAMLKKLGGDPTAPQALQLPKLKISKDLSSRKRERLYCRFLNDISEIAYAENRNVGYHIKFLSKPDMAPDLHPTETKCRPDILAIRKYSTGSTVVGEEPSDHADGDPDGGLGSTPADSESITADEEAGSTEDNTTAGSDYRPSGSKPIPRNKVHWSEIEATGEAESKGGSVSARDAQAGAYTAYHLQARPDLVSVVGIFIATSGFKLFLSNACRIYFTDQVEWTNNGAPSLLHAWMSRLYNPDKDPSITADLTSPTPTFSITTKKIKHDGPVVISAAENIGRLYNPEEDPCITAHSTPPTSSIAISDKETYKVLVIIGAGESIGRRTIVLGEEGKNGEEVIIFKEQYPERGHRFREELILKKIHEGARFPGVIRLVYSEEVKRDNKKIRVKFGGTQPKLERYKTRLVLRGRANPLMNVKTPREFLMAIYDLLEITRILYEKRGILHRDISEGNVLLYDNPVVMPQESTGHQEQRTDHPEQPTEHAKKMLHPIFGDMCFSEYLLDKSLSSALEGTAAVPSGPATASTAAASQDAPDSKNDLEQRLKTRVLLIDFDCSEDTRQVEENEANAKKKKKPMPRTGTPLFMARMVRSNLYPEGDYTLPAMPSLHQNISGHYPEKRQRDFLHYEDKKCKEFIEIPRNQSLPREEFQHLLRYDGESIYFLTLWWCALAQPKIRKTEENIADGDWASLVAVRDKRNDVFISNFPEDFLHSEYSSLARLLDDMRHYLKGDVKFSEQEWRKRPEYIHEAFQRLILNFLVANKDQDFMNLKKDEKPRESDQIARRRPGTAINTRSAAMKRKYASINEGSETDEDSKDSEDSESDSRARKRVKT